MFIKYNILYYFKMDDIKKLIVEKVLNFHKSVVKKEFSYTFKTECDDEGIVISIFTTCIDKKLNIGVYKVFHGHKKYYVEVEKEIYDDNYITSIQEIKQDW